MLPHLHQTGQSPYRQTRQEKCPFARLKNGGGRGGGGNSCQRNKQRYGFVLNIRGR